MLFDNHGQATVEILFIVMILALLLFGAFEISQGILLKHALDVGTEKAARVLSIDPGYYSRAEEIIRSEVDNNMLGGSYGDQVTIKLYDAVTMSQITPADLSNAAFGYQFLVNTELAWQADVPFMSLSNRTLESTHYGTIDRIN